jgi:DNA-binding PadR family transcriptional regulator
MRRTAGVPRGLLRFLVIRLLSEKPLSGAEIGEEITRQTMGRWKPSPGSIYPLLAWLRDKSYTRELQKENDGMKRYQLTPEGKKFLEEQVTFGKKFLKKLEFLVPMLVSGIQFDPNYKKFHAIREPARRFAMALLKLRMEVAENLTEPAVKEIGGFLTETVEKLEGMINDLKKET